MADAQIEGALPGWPTADWPAFTAGWHAACGRDAVLATWAGPWSVTFAIGCDSHCASFAFVEGRLHTPHQGAGPAFTLAAPAAVWAKFLAPVPPRHHHNVFALLMRVPEMQFTGSRLHFAQFCHVLRRVLEIGKWLVLGKKLPVAVSDRPKLAAPLPRAAITGGYVAAQCGGTDHSLYHETAGSGRDILCLHTAGSDSRQFHRLMADPRITEGHRLVAFDLPWHGRSAPPPGAVPGSWRLTGDFYVETIMAFIRAVGLVRPIVLGASMSGEICLELALRHPDAFAAIIACEATDRIEGRSVGWGAHPEVNAAMFVPEWIYGLMAPDSPAECAEDIWWQYAQGGFATFAGDIAFYAGEWDARARVGRIDTTRCKLFMLTGEYDYSCTAEMSEATAAKIPGARFTRMPGLGHFPFAENPALFAQYLLPILAEIPA